MVRSWIVLLALGFGTIACGAGAEAGTVPGAASSSVVGSPTPGGAATTVGLFRACHKRPDGRVVLIFLFREPLGGQSGAVGYQVGPVEPATWSGGDPVTVDPGVNAHVRQVTVPAEDTPPAEMILTVTALGEDDGVLGTNDVAIPVPSSACSRA